MFSKHRVWAAVLSLIFIAATTNDARASNTQTSVGVSILFVNGQHTEQSGSANAPFVPAPLLDLSHRFSRLEVVAEGIPPLRSYPVGDNVLGIQSIGLSYLQGDLRYWNTSGTFAAGIGETLYNQRTDYLMSSSNSAAFGQYDESRVAGALYEIVGRTRLRGAGTLELSVAVNPVLHGRMHWTDYQTLGGQTYTQGLQPAFERGSQFAAMLEVTHRFGEFDLHYGMRYLNYVAKFDDGSLADRNTFTMPFVGLSRLIGR